MYPLFEENDASVERRKGMSQKFVETMDHVSNLTLTENRAVAYKSTKSAVLDLFSFMGAMTYEYSEHELRDLIQNAWNEDPLLTTKVIFYMRDARGGQGVRDASRFALSWLAFWHPETAIANIPNIPFFGRWDDLYSYMGTTTWDKTMEFVRAQIMTDLSAIESKNSVSLVGKWLKSENASSSDTKALGKLTRQSLGMNAQTYRKTLSKLRSAINIVETQISTNQWESISYKTVPSGAMKKYFKAFFKHDPARMEKFIEKVNKGEEKAHSGQLFPHEIVKRLIGHRFGWETLGNPDNQTIDTMNALWKSLPDYCGENSGLVCADTSGSMMYPDAVPISVSIALGIYLGERMNGPFKNRMITFSRTPRWVELTGKSLYENIQKIPSIIENTNLEAVFTMILNVAKAYGLKQEELPKTLFIISDMEFDGFRTDNRTPFNTLHQNMKRVYSESGYELPKVIYWKVDDKVSQVPVKKDETGTAIISGFSPKLLQNVLADASLNPYDMMLQVLNSPRYEAVTLGETV
jgi:hypothetical protein